MTGKFVQKFNLFPPFSQHDQVGDCVGGLQFTHLAGYQGALAAFNAVQGIQMPGPKSSAAPGTWTAWWEDRYP